MILRKSCIYKCWVVLLTLILGTTSYGQEDELNNLKIAIDGIDSRYSRISDQFDEKELDDNSLKASLKVLILDLDSLMVISTTLNEKLDGLKASLSDLGPVPEEGAPKEAQNVRDKRSDLKKQINQLNGYLIDINDLIESIGNLRTEISNYHASKSLSGITERTVSPFSKTLWKNSLNEYKTFTKKIDDIFKKFWKALWGEENWSKLLLFLMSIVLVVAILFFPFSSFGKRISSTFKISSEDSILNKRLKLVGPPLMISILVLVALAIMYVVGNEINPLNPQGMNIVKQMIIWTVFAVFIWNFARKLFTPNLTLWNGIICAPGKGRGNRLLFVGMLYLYFGDTVLKSLFELLDSGMFLSSAQSIIFTFIFAVLLYAFFLPKRWLFRAQNEQENENEATANSLAADSLKTTSHDRKRVTNEIVFFVGRTLAILILLAIIVKYERMANFLFHRLAILTLVYIFFTSIRTIAHWIILGLTKHSQLGGKNSFNSYSKRTSLDFWVNAALDVTLVILAVPSVLFAIGFDWVDINNWIHMFLNGVEIGGITVSFQNLFNGLFSFLLIIIVVRWSVSIISKRLKEYTNLDSGVRNSIVTLLNYSGVVLALLTAVPMLGFNFTNITVVAGALSVGIGFGLQSIVKDFISGLILLIDRPVKIDDWIVVKSGQGYVKEIKSRVTIIQTFDRSKIIVPNSELVTLPMQNWFYGNRVGRVRVKVGVDFSSDPEKVREVLLSCAQQDSRILSKPKPYVLWKEFGESSLNFELRSYISNNDNAYLVRSDLHFSIFKALKEEGIVIPFPQRDLHINGSSETTAKQEGIH